MDSFFQASLLLLQPLEDFFDNVFVMVVSVLLSLALTLSAFLMHELHMSFKYSEMAIMFSSMFNNCHEIMIYCMYFV